MRIRVRPFPRQSRKAELSRHPLMPCYTVTRHIQEIELIRGKVFALEQQHNQVKKQYEEEIARLRSELEARGGPGQSSQHHGPAQPPPPSIGHGPANLFGGIMAGGSNQGLAPPPQEPQQPQGMPAHIPGPHGPPGLNPPPGAPQHFGGYPPGPSVNGEHRQSSLMGACN
jgi:glucose repression regulatory protein TUP1